MADIVLKNVSKAYGDDVVINNLNLHIKDGSFTVLVGPSGCGKSTTLRMLAGLEEITDGDILIDDEVVNNVPPGKRNVAMVFQNYALYPTMTVKGNIEFGLKNNKVAKAEREKLISEIVEIVGLSEHLNKKPQNLSGGQRQRVALARAMVKKPKVFILDEPLSNLDAKLRLQMRIELIQLHKRLGTTFVYVTHDQVEAMSMGTEIVLMDKGSIQQKDSPLEVYNNPNNKFTAEFIGTPPMNIFDAKLINRDFHMPDNAVYIGFRPEHIDIGFEEVQDAINLKSVIQTSELLGSEVIYQAKNDSIGVFRVKSFEQPIEMNESVICSIKYKNLFFFDKEGQAIPYDNQMHSTESDKAVVAYG